MAESRAPALIGSIVLHALVLGAGFIALPFAAKPLLLSSSVPITIVSHAPPEAPTASVQAPEPTPETTPEPSPTSTPPPQPMQKKAEAKPMDLSALAASLPQSKPAAKTTAKPFDLAALAATLPKSAGAKGPPHPAAAPVVNPSPPKPLSGEVIGSVAGKLMRLWNPPCGVEGGDKVVLKVEFRLQPDGSLVPGSAQVRDRSVVDSKGPVAQAAAQRALTAVSRGSPYTELPRDQYAQWKDFIATFDAREACASR